LTRTKAWRLSLAFILGFGWLFLTPAQSNLDPLSAAAAEIQELNASVPDLNYKTEFQSLIDVAESDYDAAVSAKEDMDQASDEYDQAVETEAAKLEEVNIAQSEVDGQTVTVEVALQDKNDALQDKNDAQDALDVANINLQTAQITINSAGNQGWQFSAYTLNGDRTAGSLYCTGVITQAYKNMPVCGRYENLFVVFSGKVTAPEGVNQVSFAGYTDDGFRMYVDGSLVINQWQEQGSTWSPYYYHTFTAEDRVIDVVFHYYNGGGPGVFHVGWGHSGIWTGVSSSAMSYGQGATQAQIDAYSQAVEEQQVAQSNYNQMLAIYNNKLSYYNEQNNILNTYNQTLNTKTNEYNTAVSNTASALQNKEDKEDAYDQSIIDVNDSIVSAWEYYNKQLATELAAAIAQALANQPQPEPTLEPTPEPTPQTSPEPEPEPEPEPSFEPTPEPTFDPEPTPEQTEPEDPTPTPDSETTDEPQPEPTPDPEPTPEPSPEPSPQQTDIDPEPTPEPKPTPALPSPKPSIKNTINELSAIANLTSKDNVVVKLTPEQSAAVANVLVSLAPEQKKEVAKDLGIKTEEIAIIAEAVKENPVIAAAVVEFSSRAEENQDAVMPYTLADATTELQTEVFLADPIGALTNIDFEKISNPSEWGKDMTDDQREKAQEVIVPVIIVSNIVAAAMTRRI
jgi:hypothetical protein